MNRDKDRNGDFEDRLFSELRSTVAEREQTQEPKAEKVGSTASRRRGPRLALAGGLVAAIAVAALAVTAGGNDTPTAYAVTTHGDGKISVEIRSLNDPKGLEHALDEAGVPTVVAYGQEAQLCPSTGGVPSAEGASPVTTTKGEPAEKAEAAHLTIDSRKVGPGQTLVLTAASDHGAIEASAKVSDAGGPSVESSSPVAAEGDAGSCEGLTGSPTTTHSERATEADRASAPSAEGVPEGGDESSRKNLRGGVESARGVPPAQPKG